jgi:signal transduction histidine kinase
MFTSHAFGLFAVALLGLSALTCGTLLLGGWRRRQHLLGSAYSAGPIVTARLPLGLVRAPFASGVLDVAAEARSVLAQMAAEAAAHLVQFEFATQANISVHADRYTLRAVLSELVGNAVRHAPGGRVLLSVIRLGGRVQIAVIDDGAGPDASVQEAELREMAQLVALQGGTIDVEAYPGEGTTVLVRLPELMGNGWMPGEAPKHSQAGRPAPLPRAAQEAVVEISWDI